MRVRVGIVIHHVYAGPSRCFEKNHWADEPFGRRTQRDAPNQTMVSVMKYDRMLTKALARLNLQTA